MNDTSTSLHPSTFRLRRRTPGSFVLVPCPKIGCSLRCQGQLERSAAVVMAACPTIANIQEQPFEIWYAWRETLNGIQIRLVSEKPKKRRNKKTGDRFSYIVPDFLTSGSNDRCRLVEIKPSRKLTRSDVRRKLVVAQLFARSHGWSFHLVTEEHLFSGPLISTIKLISRYRVIDAKDALLSKICQRVPGDGCAIGDLVDEVTRFADPAIAKAHLFHVLSLDELSFDPLVQPLSDVTLVFPKGVITWDPFDSLWVSNSCAMGGPFEWSANSPTTALLPKM